MSVKRFIGSVALCVGCVLLSWTPATAQVRIGTQHFITASLAGGTGLGMSGQQMIKPALGGEGQFALSYEVLHNGFFFSFGIGMDYRMSRYKLADGMVDAFATQDRDGHDIIYRYVYSNYRETQQTVSATVPVWFGYRIKDKIYFAFGAKLAMPVWNNYRTKTDLYTEGIYPNLIEYVSRNVPSYGFYPTAEYEGKGTYKAPTLSVSPMAEVGGFFRIVPGFSCRIGAYVEYAIPVMGKYATGDIVDYSAVDRNPQTQNMENLNQTIRFNSVMDSHVNVSATAHAGENLFKGFSQYLSFGIRATFRFNVTRTPSVCMCEKDK